MTANHHRRRRRLLIALAIAVLGPIQGTSSVAIATPAHHGSTVPAGKWHFAAGNEGERGGSMTVAKQGRSVRHLSVLPSSKCGGPVIVIGADKIRKGGAPGDSGPGSWHVGSSRTAGVSVRVRQTHETYHGSLYIAFNQNSAGGDASVSLSFGADQPCNSLNATFYRKK